MTSDQSPVNASSLPSPVRRKFSWWSLQIIAQSLTTFWFRYRARGLEHLPDEGGALLLINHRSLVDPVLTGLALRRPVSFVARDSLFRVPLLGPLFRINYVIPINRDAAGTASLREIVRRLEHGFLVGLYPEGTRYRGNNPLGRLKPGFISILRRTDVPVIPVGIAGAFGAMPRGTAVVRPATIRVVIGERIPPAHLDELKSRGRESELLALVESRMSESVIAAQEWLKLGVK